MASPLTSPSSGPAFSTQLWNYDVFICYRAIDTRTSFVDHLLAALHQRGIIPYVDIETLPPGALIISTLLKAIKESRFAVVVFSENFVVSSYSLNELEYIISCRDETGQIVIPIYYHVDPSEVRKQTGAFDVYKRVDDKNKVESWSKALVDASYIPGWIVDKNVPESLCIKQIVDTTANKLFLNKVANETGTYLQDLKLSVGDSEYDHFKILKASKASQFSSKFANHDAFLSFRREDTRNNFVDHFYSALSQHEILTFMAKETFFFNPLHTNLKAIEKSRISIIIFSKNYASSSSCMDELAYIMKCRDDRGQIVIPIYYDVNLSEVRTQSGNYEKAFSGYESMDHFKADLWRKTLKDVCNLFGWEIRYTANGHEAKGIQLIVKKISNILFPDRDIIRLHTRLGDMKYGVGGMLTIPSPSCEDLKQLPIPFHEILLATNNFSKSNIIAEGGFGKVYQGVSEKHGTIAVKQLDRRHGQGDNEFMMEIALLSAYKHENIVSLVGYCDQDGEKILVLKYEYNGSLDKHLPSKGLSWIQRLHICLDAAKGLKYLHEEVGPQHRILHRDIKSSNILLDENFKAKISDFGLSKIALANVPFSVIISRVCGTLGYVDPQYQDHNILTQKSDVYSFGVVLFEVMCSRLVNVRQYQDECHFSAKLAQNHYEKETLDEIIDSGLRSQMNTNCLSTYSTIAYQCLKKRREERPTMGLVVDQLEKALDYQQVVGSGGSWHDVYISFRHRDAECNIVDDIYAALHQEGVSTYQADVTVSRKESILLKAIERSRLFVIIFTKKFAANSWYLDEVAKIIECMQQKRQFVLPVFHNVSRSDVQTQKGYFGEVMSEYDTHPRMEVWRNALVEATNASGSSADFVKKIVEEIKNGLSGEKNRSLPEGSIGV